MNLLAWLAAGAVIATAPVSTQQPALPSPATQAVASPGARVFGSDTGLVLNFIKADKTADFEAVMAKLKDALEASTNPVRKQQAASWRVYKSSEPAAGGAALYVYIVDPPVKGADYYVTAILSEAFAADELSALFKQYNEAYATGQNFVNLTLVSDLGK